MKRLITMVLLLWVFEGAAFSLRAQAPPPMPEYQPLADAQLDQLLGPIALYPDPLVAEILTAATLPEQVVIADRYIGGGGDPGQIEAQAWDASVQGLAHYPEVLKWLDDNLNWTTEVGQAFLNQQPDVMSSLQRLRQSAYNLGNLQSTPQESVTDDNGYIEITPADPNTIYLPSYQPDQVYDQPAGGAPFITFNAGWPVGGWLTGDFDWRSHQVIQWSHDHPRPANWWRQPAGARPYGAATVWHPGIHPGNAHPDSGDRGWDTPDRNPRGQNQPGHPPVVTMIGHANSPAPQRVPERAGRPAEPAPHFEPATSGAFIGVQNSQDTKAYSNRGRQSLQPQNHTGPVTRPASSPGGGHEGGGPNHR